MKLNKLRGLASILLYVNLTGMPSIQNEAPKDSYCTRGYWGIRGIFYVDTENKISKLMETYEFTLLECLEYKVKEQNDKKSGGQNGK